MAKKEDSSKIINLAEKQKNKPSKVDDSSDSELKELAEKLVQMLRDDEDLN